jgi:hypothetical protein
METTGLLLPEEFESWNRTEQIKYIGETWLEAEGATSPDDTRSGKEIVEGTKQRILSVRCSLSRRLLR